MVIDAREKRVFREKSNYYHFCRWQLFRLVDLLKCAIIRWRGLFAHRVVHVLRCTLRRVSNLVEKF